MAMKIKFLYLMIITVSTIILSCSDDDADSFFSCLGETSITHIVHNIDSNNALQVNFEIEYNGDYSLSNVQWDFGDGSSGSGATTSHTYNSAGTYLIKASVSVNEEGNNCSFTKDKSITVD